MKTYIYSCTYGALPLLPDHDNKIPKIDEEGNLGNDLVILKTARKQKDFNYLFHKVLPSEYHHTILLLKRRYRESTILCVPPPPVFNDSKDYLHNLIETFFAIASTQTFLRVAIKAYSFHQYGYTTRQVKKVVNKILENYKIWFNQVIVI